MSTNRRSFLRNIALGGGAIATGIPSLEVLANDDVGEGFDVPQKQRLAPGDNNMCGYAAPKLEKVRIGFIGLGMRGPGAVERMSHIDGVEIKALCDKYPERTTKAQEILRKAGLPAAREYSGEDGWKAMCDSADIDLVYICTPWSYHTPMAVYAMKAGKHAATEV
ncbi:MAG: Gfo/Idh/MocA family oxidoreductase, partial [Bacteroidota bacterium]